MKIPFIVIMAGGIGSRFWPESTVEMPKQFLDILGTGKSLLQMTRDRFLSVSDNEHMLVITNEKYKELVRDQLPEIPEHNILCEPSRNNTAPCVAYASLRVQAMNPDSVIVVTPSDHVVLKENVFNEVIHKAVEHAKKNNDLITLGIQPVRPDTGYGYIHMDKNGECNGIFKVISFKEKPKLEIAQSYLDSGDYVWNSGVFIWGTQSILNAFQNYAPSILSVLTSKKSVYNTGAEQEFIDKVYPETERISIDYAILEKADNIYVIPADIGWSDLGTWKSLHEYLPKDNNKNQQFGEIVAIDIENSFIRSTTDRQVIIKGLKNYIIIDSKNGLLIYPMDDEQEIKSIR